MESTYKPNWKSLREIRTPAWLKRDKFGIYTHWGIYSVPATGPNVTWYPYNMYREGTSQYDYHLKTYGHPSTFGYKDFIPDFTGTKFDAAEWAELFKRAGARFAGPVAEHHDGFALWDTKYSKWNAAKMGPKRDVVGELADAYRAEGMRFMCALHHAEHWWWYPNWRKDFDVSDPQYKELYGEHHTQTWADESVRPVFKDRVDEWDHQDKPSKAFLDIWLGKICELIDNYQPDLLWFDFGIRRIQEHYKRQFLAYYYNKAKEWGRETAVTYKWHNMVPGSGVVDLELGRFDQLTYHDWITDTTVDDGHGWAYLKDADYKSPTTLIHYLIDNVSKNGYLLLNVGPKPNGEIPEEAKFILHEIGRWLDLNGEAIYGTTPWVTYGEGPTQMSKAGPFMEDKEVNYSAKDMRITAKDDHLYVTCLGWPTEPVLITSFKELYAEEIRSVSMIGVDQPLSWQMRQEGLQIVPPKRRPCDHAYVFKIERQNPFAS